MKAAAKFYFLLALVRAEAALWDFYYGQSVSWRIYRWPPQTQSSVSLLSTGERVLLAGSGGIPTGEVAASSGGPPSDGGPPFLGGRSPSAARIHQPFQSQLVSPPSPLQTRIPQKFTASSSGMNGQMAPRAASASFAGGGSRNRSSALRYLQWVWRFLPPPHPSSPISLLGSRTNL
jgi:hypothetical protein